MNERVVNRGLRLDVRRFEVNVSCKMPSMDVRENGGWGCVGGCPILL